jgi:ABC-type branched-subunit amino acid transport system substrate-binding protein
VERDAPSQATGASYDLTGALKQITGTNAIQGVTGRISFKDNGDQQGKRIILEHVEGTSLKVDDSQGCFRLTDTCANN